MNRIVFLFTGVILCIPAKAQIGISPGCFDQGLNPTYGQSIALMDGNDGIVVAGTMRQPGHQGSAIRTLRYSGDGDLLWSATFQSDAKCFDVAASAAVARDHSVYVAGASWKEGFSGTDAVLLRYDEGGREEWRFRHPGPPGRNEARAVLLDSQDNAFLVVQLGRGPDSRMTLLKLSPTGELLWEHAVSHGGLRVGKAALDQSGRVVVTGSLCSSTASEMGSCTDTDLFTVVYDSAGHMVWEARYHPAGAGAHQGVVVAAAPGGDVLVAGHRCNDAPAAPSVPGAPIGGAPCRTGDMLLLRYDAAGNLRWEAKFNDEEAGVYEASALSVDGNGFAVLAGNGSGQNQGFFVVKFDPFGNRHWAHRYHHEAYEVVSDLTQDWQGGIYVTGGSVADSYLEFATVKLDMYGERQWVARYWGRGDRDFTAMAIAVDLDGRAVVTGGTLDRIGVSESSIITIRYTPDGSEGWVARENTVQP